MKQIFGMMFAVATLATGCSDPCGDLAKKKAECAKQDDSVKASCETTVEAVIKTGQKESCKAYLDSWDASWGKTVKK